VSTHQIHIFISHSWGYSGHYETLRNWIFDYNWSFGQASLSFKDYSAPATYPIQNAPTDAALMAAIHAKISRTHVVVIPTGMYASRSKWIQKEIDSANLYSKPIVAVDPWGARRTSSVVSRAAAETIGWNSRPIIEAIWRQYIGRSSWPNK
jgi:hypothetical protein